MQAPIKISIVTPSLNQGAYVARSVASVAAQGIAGVEHIVVDGGSTDGAREILAASPSVTLVDAPGLDSHSAINLGLGMAKGEVVGFLNTDDYYAGGALSAVLEAFAAHPAVPAVCGAMTFFSEEGGRHETRRHLSSGEMLIELLFGAPGFNSWFFRRSALSAAGPLDAALAFSADREFLLRTVRGGGALVLDRVVYHYRVHGGSRTMNEAGRNVPAIAIEHVHTARRYRALSGTDASTASLLRAWQAFETLRSIRWSVRLGRLRPIAEVLGAQTMAELLAAPLALPRAFAARRRLRRQEAG